MSAVRFCPWPPFLCLPDHLHKQRIQIAKTLRQLLDADSPVERFERELLLSHVFDKNRAWIWAHLEDSPVSQKQINRYSELLERRAAGHPIAYLTGFREFYGREFQVSQDVLIPRPETELLVDLALELLPVSRIRIIDVGTGSGAIGLTLAAERPAWQITVSDISSAALRVAADNQSRLRLDQVRLLESHLLDQVLSESFDLVISNPPYIANDDSHLLQGDLRFEPAVALSSGPDGLDLIRKLVAQALRVLKPRGWLLMEHGHDQAGAVRALLANSGFDSIRSWSDLAKIERVTGGRVSS